MITISEPHYLLFYLADCKYTAVITQCLEMPYFSIITKIFTTQRLTCGKSVLQLFHILGGIQSKLENYGFHKQNFDYFRFKSNETINKAKKRINSCGYTLSFYRGKRALYLGKHKSCVTAISQGKICRGVFPWIHQKEQKNRPCHLPR